MTFRQYAYGFAVFLSSACGLIVEIVAGRLLAPYVGMSLYTWTAIIAVVLAGLSVGHWVGGLLAAPHVDPRQGGRRVAAALILAALSSLAVLVLLRALSGVLLGAGLAPIPAIVFLTTALFFLPSLFVGIVSPILTKLAVDAAPGNHGRVIGRMYALGTLGSIAGTLAAGYLFISWIGSTGTVISVAIAYGILGLAFATVDTARVALVALLALGAGGLGWWGQSLRAFESPCAVESDYFCIRIGDFSAESGRASALMVLDHLVHSINDRDDPGLLYSPYIHFVDEAAKLRLPAGDTTGDGPAAFFIGGGGYSLPRAWAAAYPGSRLTVAELDPAVTAVAAEHLWLADWTNGLDIRHGDARAVLQSAPARPTFDLVFGDAFHDISIPAHLVTREFHAEIAKRLKPGGFYALNAVDRGDDPRFLLSLVRTLAEDFAEVEVWVDADEAGLTDRGFRGDLIRGRVTFVVLASDTPSSAPILRSFQGLERTWARWPAKDLSARIARADPPVLTDDFAPVDRLMAHLLVGGDSQAEH